MVVMGRFQRAAAVLLLTVAFAASATAAAPVPDGAPSPPGAPMPPAAPTPPETPSTAAITEALRETYGEAKSTMHEAAAPARELGSGSPSNPHPETVPVPERTMQAVQKATQPIRDLVPSDAVGTARQAAEEASRLPQDLLAPEPVAEETTATTPQSTAPRAALPSLLAPTLLIAAGAATAATFFGFWLAGSSGAVGSKAAASAVSRAGDLRRLLPFASPLFTRFERGTVLGHPRREALYALILQEPGISLQALGDATGLSRTAVIHHLRLMELQHLVVSRRVGRSRHYFENGGRYGHDQKEAYAILQNDRSKAVAEFIKGHPGAMQKALCEALGIQPSIAHWHVRRLEEARIVETMRKGRTVAYFPGPGLSAMDATAASQSAAAAPA